MAMSILFLLSKYSGNDTHHNIFWSDNSFYLLRGKWPAGFNLFAGHFKISLKMSGKFHEHTLTLCPNLLGEYVLFKEKLNMWTLKEIPFLCRLAANLPLLFLFQFNESCLQIHVVISLSLPEFSLGHLQL